MATITEKTPGRFSVMIRQKNYKHGATFSNKEDAVLWSKYKEDLAENIKNFNPPKHELVRFDDAIDWKKEEAERKGLDKKSIQEIENTKIYFKEFTNMNMHEITYDMLLETCQEMLNSNARRGGNNTGGGKIGQISKMTVLKRFAILSSIYSFLQQKAIACENIPMKIVTYLRSN